MYRKIRRQRVFEKKLLTFLLLCFFLAACKQEVLNDLSELQANSLIAHLHTVDIEAQRERQADGRWSLLADETQVQEALHVLSRARLLETTVPEIPQAENSFFGNNTRSSFQYQKWVSDEIRQTLRTLPGVLDARVHLNFVYQESLFSSSQENRSSGSVLLIVEPESTLSNEEIAHLVAGAAGIEEQAVSVMQTIDKEPVQRLGLYKREKGQESQGGRVAYLQKFFLTKKGALLFSAFFLVILGTALLFIPLAPSYKQKMSTKK